MLSDRTSKHVGTATELTCLVPIRSGFIPTLDTRTFATRLRVVFKALQTLRVASREVKATKPILDIVDAARTVQAFSWAVVAERQLLLNVAFDRPWEPYIRVIWRDLGRLLDLFLCNCEGFVSSRQGFDEYADFVRRHQIDTAFFYPSSSLTVDDQRYLVELEKIVRDGKQDVERRVAEIVVPGAEQQSATARETNPVDARVQWQTALGVMYGLRSFYPEESDDHLFLHGAAHALLDASRPEGMPASKELLWFDEVERAGSQPPERVLAPGKIQGGVLKPYTRVSHGCLLLARIESPDLARGFITQLESKVTRDNSAPSDTCVNVAFTFNGLRQLGVNDSELQRFPKEFQEGMEARAGLLGDVRQNHPENWTLPEWNVQIDSNPAAETRVRFEGSLAPARPAGTTAPPAPPPIRMATLDLAILLHRAGQWDTPSDWDSMHPLYKTVQELCTLGIDHGVRVLSVQPLQRFSEKRREGQAGSLSRDHFGLMDGISQPNAVATPKAPDDVELGELLVGFENKRMDAAFQEKGPNPMQQRDSLLDCGSFLVVRKLRQDVQAWRTITDSAAASASMSVDDLRGKLLGRRPDGSPIIDRTPGAPRNDFSFGSDENGERCPFHAHIRRANPRLPHRYDGIASPVVPRIARRGLAYGPAFDKKPDAERGMLFMAYNANIAEQFEIIQRWMTGGNTPAAGNGTAIYSGQPDPLLGLPDESGRRVYRFTDEQKNVRQIDLGTAPFVTLQWGLYLFTPSIAALGRLSERPQPDQRAAEGQLALGRRVMASLQSEADWAAVLEDISAVQSGVSAAVLATIRADHHGVKRTPYGVIVANHALGMQVLSDDGVYSVREYQRRFSHSVGEGYLGMDSGPAYGALSEKPNAILESLTQNAACETAFTVTKEVLAAARKRSVAGAVAVAGPHLVVNESAPVVVPLPLEPVIDQVLGQLAHAWFDIPTRNLPRPGERLENPLRDEARIWIGGRPEDLPLPEAERAASLHCPYHFLAPSRYVFSSPNPRTMVVALGEDHGSRLLTMVRRFVQERRAQQEATGDSGLKGPLSKALFAQIPDEDFLARALLGLVFGFVPTVYGNALQTLGLWLSDESLWRLQQQWKTSSGTLEERVAVLERPLARAMLVRALPPILHRTANAAATLEGVNVVPGDRVVVSVSGMAQDAMSRGVGHPTTVFGGDRTAPSHPTHACPGSHIAMGVLLGMMGAILDAGVLAPTPALITVRVVASSEELQQAQNMLSAAPQSV